MGSREWGVARSRREKKGVERNSKEE